MDMNRETEIFECLVELYMESELELVRECMAEVQPPMSERFRRRIRGIILRESAVSVARRVAAVILTVLTVTGSLMLINEEVRAGVIRFFQKIYQTHTEYHFQNDAMEWDGAFRLYEPTWLPEGYREGYRSTEEAGLSIRYDHASGREIYYFCRDERVSGVSLNTENTECQEIRYQGEWAEYYASCEEGFLSSFVWGNEYGCYFALSGDLTLDECMQIADSLEAKEESETSWIVDPPVGYEVYMSTVEQSRKPYEQYFYLSEDRAKTFSLSIQMPELEEMIREMDCEIEELVVADLAVRGYHPVDPASERTYIWRDGQGTLFILQGSMEKEEMQELVAYFVEERRR